jgi:hypothetical protein
MSVMIMDGGSANLLLLLRSTNRRSDRWWGTVGQRGAAWHGSAPRGRARMGSLRVRDCRLLAVRARASHDKGGDFAAVQSRLRNVLDGIVRAFSSSLRGESPDAADTVTFGECGSLRGGHPAGGDIQEQA